MILKDKIREVLKEHLQPAFSCREYGGIVEDTEIDSILYDIMLEIQNSHQV